MSSQDALDSEQSVLLSDATLSALQLPTQPFSPIAPEDNTFSDEVTAEQLADIKQALITGDDLLLILGESGAGKTTLLRQLSENSGLRIQCFSVKGTARFSTLNLFAGMLEAFKRPSPEKLKDILDELIPCLQTMVTRNTLSAIVLDDADMINETELTQLLSSMLYINSQDETLMRVTLAAPAAFEDRIPELLPEGADLPYSSLTIEGMSAPRAASYLEFKLQEAGFEGEWPFTDPELDQLVETSAGLPQPFNAAVANELNQQHGPLEETMPVELLTEAGDSFAQSRTGKLVLGLAATVFIIGGLSMFMSNGTQRNERVTVAQQSRVELPDDDAPKLQLIEEQPLASSSERRAESTNSDSPLSANAGLSGADAPEGLAGSLASTEDATAAIKTSASASDNPVSASAVNSSDILQETADSSSLTNASAEADTASTAVATVTAAAQPDAADPESSTAATVAAAVPAASEVGSSSIAAQAVSDTESAATQAAAVPADPVSSAVSALANAASSAPGNTPSDAELLASSAQTEVSSPNAESSQAEAAASDEPANALANVLESPTWILVQDSKQFTVQMSASRDRPSVENFLKRNAEVLGAPNSIYTFVRNEDTWYALVHGLYPSISEARAAVERLPAGALTNQPWIRNIGRVQDALKAQ